MNIQFLLKFGEIEHLTELLNFGHVYIKPGDFFKKNIDHGRFDKTYSLAPARQPLRSCQLPTMA